jgi:hypothetical protein
MIACGIALAMAVQIPLKPQMVFTKTSSVEAKTYRIASKEDLKTPAVEIRGNGITVDFQKAILEGTPQTVQPNERKGLGVLVSGNNITIKNLKVRGYKVGLIARNCSGLKVIDSDFSYNWKQHLASTLDKEDLSDWMSFHHNEKDEWLEYGAGIYLNGCTGFEVKGCKVEGGQCGLMMTRSNKGLVWNNSFSFLSAIGLGMYRSSENRIMHNNIDWCVRGFSYGVYNRGQDSAGILIYEQSNKNVFAYNSVTHGGDGFFLWAGQTTMDTGEGGCNDNLLYGNDFSHAPTNGIEATFSRNNFVNNLILECWHGIWGGYSYDSKVIGNIFGYNAEAIAWEHGQDNLVDHNLFRQDHEGVYIWSNPSQDPNWGYAKKRDTRSRDWTITHNTFGSEFTSVLHVRRSQNIKFTDNTLIGNGGYIKNDGDVTSLLDNPNNLVPATGIPHAPSSSLNQGFTTKGEYLQRFDVYWNPLGADVTSRPTDITLTLIENKRTGLPYAPKALTGGKNPFLRRGTLRGWRYMMVDEWGPYDFKSPLLWPREQIVANAATKTQRYEVLGPRGAWKVRSLKNATLSSSSGSVPGFVDVTTPMTGASTIQIDLEYIGAETTDYRGIVTKAGQPVKFGYSKFFAPIDWTIRFYKWSKSSNPAEVHAAPDEAALQEIFKGAPLTELKRDRLEFAGSSFDKVTGNDHFATVAEGMFEVPPGDYTLELTTDDGARLWLDGKQIVDDAWKYQGPTLYSRDVKLGAGKHALKVEHFQIDGYGALKVNLRPKK